MYAADRQPHDHTPPAPVCMQVRYSSYAICNTSSFLEKSIIMVA